ncbi:PhzF family phenazine biosynthesis protein [Jiangella muralis]|uniref:PhzF family phenazine biosynthesis protein n=1 Tax=Jiangella muralis TaxID=702383 RepID=UPI001969D58E|nr:PhzF family phenazine biosynthesis protein [Jiangella muralis]
MIEPRFFFVDVFASRPLSGNPLVVVPDADELSEPQMQALAREFNQSETTFILEPDLEGADWKLRSFTPTGAEVGGAGHNALGACLWLAAARLPRDRERFVQQIGRDLLPVLIDRWDEGVVVSMDQAAPRFGRVAPDRPELAAALGIGVDDLAAADAVVVSTGAGHLLAPLRTSEAVDRARPDPRRLSAALRAVGGEGCYVYCLEDPRNEAHAYARFFNPAMGIGEDPATGTAAGPLAARLVADGVVPDGSTVVVEQGHAIGRPSRLSVTVAGDLVRLSGGGLVVADGILHLGGQHRPSTENPLARG